MKFLLDQGLPRDAVRLLAEAGIESQHVGNLGLAHASDESILARASSDAWVVVTMDSDFHALLALSGATGPSTIRIRVESLKARQIAELLIQILELTSQSLAQGALVTVDERSVRVRLLPIQHDR